MINKLIDDIIDLVNEQRDSQGMITKVNLKDEIKTLLELNFKNNCALDDVSSTFVCEHPKRQRHYYSDTTYKCWKCKKIVLAN
jgi:hypothetical protein